MGSIFNFNSWGSEKYADVSPQAPDQYRNGLWQLQSAIYDEMWDYYNGDIFDETLNERTDHLKYPLGVNLLKEACINHRSTLFGEFTDDVLQFRVRSKRADSSHVEEVISRIWRNSSLNSILLESGLLAMIMGGTVMRIVWHPVHEQIYLRMVPADAFFPVWDPDDYHNLLEVYIYYNIDGVTANKRFNVNIKDDQGIQHLVAEHWTQEGYDVTVDGELGFWDRERSFPMAGRNQYIDPLSKRGIIPFEYFPRDRAGSFYGAPLGVDATRLQNYFNSQLGDISDAILASTHHYKFLTGRPTGLSGLENLSRSKLNNLGMGAPGQPLPNVFAVPGAEVPPTVTPWMNTILGLGRNALFTPAVAYGEDEGSQRSALTLSFRMWPLSSAVRVTRGFWSDCFRSLHRKLLIVAATRKGLGISWSNVDYETAPVWSNMLPRDRESDVQEVVLRKQAGLISKHHSLEMLEDAELFWIEEELDRIEEDARLDSELTARSGGFETTQAQPEEQITVPE